MYLYMSPAAAEIGTRTSTCPLRRNGDTYLYMSPCGGGIGDTYKYMSPFGSRALGFLARA
jgi:hypothetical protein